MMNDDNLVPSSASDTLQPIWFGEIVKAVADVNLFPHCKLGEGYAPYAIGSDTGCILISQIDVETDVDEAAYNLEKAKECLSKDSPNSHQVMVFILNPKRRIDNPLYERRNIHCLTERQFIDYAVEYFSESNERIRLGKAAYYQGQYGVAVDLLMGIGVDCDDEAQFLIGQMYAQGRGVCKSRRKAEDWYWKAARKGNVLAMRELEKYLSREEIELRRKEDEIVAEIEAFAEKLVSDDK